MLGMPGVDRNDPRRFALGVLNSALGGGMSSRLFQEVREKRGLAYSVYSYHAQYSDAGLFGVYAGCLPKKVDDVLDLCRAEIQRVCHRGITAEELDRGKGQLRGSLVLGMEDTGSRMNRIGKSELVYGEMLSLDEILRRIDDVTLDDVREVASDVLDVAPTLAVIGPFDRQPRLLGGRCVVSSLKVAVVGAAGRMGQQTCAAVDEADDLELVARIDRGDTIDDAAAAQADVVVDFTVPDAALANVEAALSLGLHVVVGTSGFDAARLAQVETLTDRSPGLGVVIAPNFAIGAVLLMRSHARPPPTSRRSRSSRPTTPTSWMPPAARQCTPRR